MFLFVAIALVCGYSINLAYMELVRSEQRLATDASAKAASVILGKTQSADQARVTAKTVASKHMVAGRSFTLSDSDIVFGVCDRQADNSLKFTAGSRGNLLNAVKIDSDLKNVSNGGASLLVFPNVFQNKKFDVNLETVATRVDLDVCVVIDRSGSMAWDLTNVPWSYPGTLQGQSTIQNYFQPPHPTLSRWAALTTAVNSFLTVVKANPFDVHVSMASYSSNFTFGVYSSVVATLDQALTNDYTSIGSKLTTYGATPLIGNTNIAAGLREGINSLTDTTKIRTTACKTLILITDGVMTQGDDPVTLAALAKQSNIRVHTIAFSAQADVNLMRNIAAAGGGNAYVAPDAATLNAAFREIAETLPAMIAK